MINCKRDIRLINWKQIAILLCLVSSSYVNNNMALDYNSIKEKYVKKYR